MFARTNFQKLDLSKAGVDKGSVIWHSSWNPCLDLILRYQIIAYLEGVI